MKHADSLTEVPSSTADIIKVVFHKTQIGFASILQCTKTLSKNSSPCHGNYLRIYTVYAVKEGNLLREADPLSPYR